MIQRGLDFNVLVFKDQTPIPTYSSLSNAFNASQWLTLPQGSVTSSVTVSRDTDLLKQIILVLTLQQTQQQIIVPMQIIHQFLIKHAIVKPVLIGQVMPHHWTAAAIKQSDKALFVLIQHANALTLLIQPQKLST